MYQQIWRQESYVPRKNTYLVDLPQNHLNVVKSVKFEFKDYKVYQKLGCLPYERMVIQCANNYGALFHLHNQECRDVKTLFKQCVQTNAAFNYMKKIRPQYFAENQYSRDKPTFKELQI